MKIGKKVKNFIGIILINMFIFLILIICIDPLLEKLSDTSINLYDTHRKINLKEFRPDLNTSIMPTDDYMVYTQNLEKRENHLSTDKNGYITGPAELNVKYNSIDVLFFGGSTTECLFVDEDKRFPYLVGKKLSVSKKRSFVVRNAGASGKNTMESLLDYYAKGMKFKPKVVVLMHNINDLTQLLYTGSYWDGPQTRSLIKQVPTSRFSHLKEFIFPKNTIAFLKRHIPSFLNKALAKYKTDEWADYRIQRKIDFDELKKQYKQALTAFISISKIYGVQVVLMTQFNRFNKSDTFSKYYYDSQKPAIDFYSYCDYYKSYNQVIRETAFEQNVTLVDLAKIVPQNQEYIYDVVHLNNKGSILVSDSIFNSINKLIYQ